MNSKRLLSIVSELIDRKLIVKTGTRYGEKENCDTYEVVCESLLIRTNPGAVCHPTPLEISQCDSITLSVNIETGDAYFCDVLRTDEHLIASLTNSIEVQI